MHSVLVVGSVWPHHPGGARVPGLVKYLPAYGWKPVVLTWPLPNGVDLPYRIEAVGGDERLAGIVTGMGFHSHKSVRAQLAERLGISSDNAVLRWTITRAREILNYPDEHKKWRRDATLRALALVQEERFDAVISTSPPISCHMVAAELSRQCGLPWVADFPHLWSQDHGVPYGSIRRWFDRRLERRTLATANVLATINAPLASELNSLHTHHNVRAIEHGFDPETLNLEPVPTTREFTITYTGGFSLGSREPRMFLSVLRGLFDTKMLSKRDVRVRFYGPREDWVQAQIAEAGIEDIVTQFGRVPQSEAFARQRESQVLLIPKSQVPLEGMISSKFYEYLAARRPILAVGGHTDVVNEKLQETRAGVACESREETAEALHAYYEEYRASGTVACNSNLAEVMRYSHQEMARQFVLLLDDMFH